MQTLKPHDLFAVNALLIRIADPCFDGTTVDRRAILFAGIAELIQADFWNYVNGIHNPEIPGDAMLTRSLDGGFQSDKERADFFRISLHPDLAGSIQGAIHDAIMAGKSIVARRRELVSNAKWKSLPVARESKQAGFDDFILAVKPITYGHSGLGFHRRWGRDPFTMRDRRMVEYFFFCVPWIHIEPRNENVLKEVLSLSPRERQVLVLLFDGVSRAEIAKTLQLSVHTVVDYLKAVYKKLGVNSHKQLLARFHHVNM